MDFIHYRASERGRKDSGWLQSNFTFSFSDYYDPSKAGFGLLRAFNDDFVQPGKGFGIHPRENMEIISVMLRGSMNHKDSLGYDEVVHQDWVQVMSAGQGLRHEEYNIGEETANFLQIWIEPKLHNIPPRYQKRHFPKSARRNELRTIISSEVGRSHCWINQQARLSLGYFDADRVVDYRFSSNNKCVFLFAIRGGLSVNQEELKQRDGIGLWNTDHLVIESAEMAEFLIVEVPINH
jgi:redox-sensitive bicupin YhaK (pirin superfamily)